MAVFHPYSVRCNCGHTFEAKLARSVNGGRSRQLRDAILAGTFHRVRCAECTREFTVEKPFTYADFKTNTFFTVRPRWDRHEFRQASSEFAGALRKLPKKLSPDASRTARVVFGLQELREKLVAQDAGLDDRLIELLKMYLLHEHPFLLQKPRLRMVLHRVNMGACEFIASHDHSEAKFRLSVPQWVALDFVSRRAELENLLDDRHDFSPFREDAPWANLWRYSPQTSALADLQRYADTVRAGGPVDFDSKDFQLMVRRLPRGAHLPDSAKQELRVVFKRAKAQHRGDVQDTLFEVRFGFPLDDDWGTNADNGDIDVLWDVLKDLPDSNVEGATSIGNLLLDKGQGGGWYDPNSFDVGIGEAELSDRDRFEDVVRHEIGHAVHEQHEKTVDAWLQERFGWQRFNLTDAGVDAWVDQMGGWDSSVSLEERSRIRHVLRQGIGFGGRWGPGVVLKPPQGHPWWKQDLAPRLAYEQSGAKWYLNHAAWFRRGGKAFFVNYWYAELMVVDEATCKLIKDIMPDPYAAMSPFEFFAELYALFHDPKDPRRNLIPDEVRNWLADNFGAPEFGAPKAA